MSVTIKRVFYQFYIKIQKKHITLSVNNIPNTVHLFDKSVFMYIHMNKLFDMTKVFLDQMVSHARIYNIVLIVNIFLYFLVISVCISADEQRLKLFSYKWTYREESKDWEAIEVSNIVCLFCSFCTLLLLVFGAKWTIVT